MLVMYDSIIVSTVPANPPAVAGYTGGSWATFEPLRRAFPNAKHLSIAVTSGGHGRCLDVEPGDATNASAVAWWRSGLADRSQGKPVFYTSASNANALTSTLAGSGIARSEWLLWSAHYTYQPHICGPKTCGYPQADGTQWTDHAFGRNLDQSVVSDAFFGPAPPPPDPNHYGWYDRIPRQLGGGSYKEVDTARQYDFYRAQQTFRRHPHRLELGRLRDLCSMFAGRISSVAEHGGWNADHRQWRHDQLVARSQGRRLV